MMPSRENENLDDVIADLIDDDPTEDTSNTATSPFDGIDTTPKEIKGPPVQLTERAAKQVEKILEDENFDEQLFLRVAVEGGGCSGLSYKLGLDKKTTDDKVIDSRGIQIIVDTKHLVYLQGIHIDYPDGLDARGFTFDNPNATETCGCGSSFAT